MNTPSVEIPRRELAFRDERGGFSLTLKRNCSISPAGLACAFAALALLALAIGAGFAAAGAWLVLPFAGLEALALGAAYLLYARRAADYERIELDGTRLTVERGEAERLSRHVLQARGAELRVERRKGGEARVWLCGTREELELGRHLGAEARVELAAELAKRLRIRIGERGT